MPAWVQTILEWIGKALSAIIIAGMAFLTGLVPILVGDTLIADITQGQWAVIALGTLSAGAAVFGITNRSS